MKKNISIVGSRNFKTFDHLQQMYEFITEIIDPSEIKLIISGGAQGADTLARAFAESINVDIKEYLPDWEVYGKRAGFIRNKYIIENGDIVFAFWDGKSRGTLSSIKIVKELGKEIHIFYFDEKDKIR